MSERDRYADGAIGFVLGLGLALLLALWDGSSEKEGINPGEPESMGDVTANQQIGKNETHYWFRGLPVGYVFTEDSLAQWLMALFSLGALVVSWEAVKYVRKTLTATVVAAEAASDSVAETRRFGELQERPWLTVQFQIDNDIVRGDREWTTRISGVVKNIGKTTALDVTIDADLLFWPILPEMQNLLIGEYASRHEADQDFPIPGPIHIFPGESEVFQRGVHISTQAVDDAKRSVPVGLHHFCLIVCVSYRTVIDSKDTIRKLTVVGRDIYKFREGSDYLIDLFRGTDERVSKARLILRPPIGKSAVIT